MRFVNGMHVIKDNMFPLPPLFRILHEQSGTPWEEMYKVFNMGHRFEIFTEEKYAGEIIRIASGFNLEARVVGHCEKASSNRLTIRSEFGSFEY
jgi:phosphoribosylformylglycinamidine cyclo-ligase